MENVEITEEHGTNEKKKPHFLNAICGFSNSIKDISIEKEEERDGERKKKKHPAHARIF